MIRLIEVTEGNWLAFAALKVKDEQQGFLAPAIGILARGYVYRNCNARVFGITDDTQAVGMALVRDFTDEPVGYDLQQFMIDAGFQNRGYGTQALKLVLQYLKKEARYGHVEVCVNREDTPAIHVYEKVGFVDSEYVDEELPECRNLIYYLEEK